MSKFSAAVQARRQLTGDRLEVDGWDWLKTTNEKRDRMMQWK